MQRFCKNIRKLIFSVDKILQKLTFLNMITNEMMLNINVPSPRMMDGMFW